MASSCGSLQPPAPNEAGTEWPPRLILCKELLGILAVLLSAPKQDSSSDFFWHRGNRKHSVLPSPLMCRACSLSDWLCSPEQRLMCSHMGTAGVGIFIFCLTLQLSQGFKEHFHYSVAVVRHFHGLTASMPNHCSSHRWISLSVSTFHFPEIQNCSLSKERTTIRK